MRGINIHAIILFVIIKISGKRLGLTFKGNIVFSLLCVSSIKSGDSKGDYAWSPLSS